MSRFLSYTFPAGNATDVCAPQTIVAAGNLVLNGNLVNKVTGVMSFVNQGYSRQVSITSTNNLTGRTFTVNGTQNGVPITENITGGNTTTVYGTLIYDVITSITVDGAVASNVSVGSGWQGFFPLIGINLERDVINYTLTLGKLTAANVNTAVFGTLSNLVNNGHTYLDSITNNYNVFDIKVMGSSDNYVYTNAGNIPTYSSLIIQLGASNASIDKSMQMNFIQI